MLVQKGGVVHAFSTAEPGITGCRRRCSDHEARDQSLGQVGAGFERFRVMSGANQMHGVTALTQGLEIIGNGEIRPIVSAGGPRPADELFPADTRQQFETDQVNRRRPVANAANHLGCGPTVDDQRFRFGADFPWPRLGLEIGDRHGQENDVDRLRFTEHLLQSCRIVGYIANLERIRASADRAFSAIVPEACQA